MRRMLYALAPVRAGLVERFGQPTGSTPGQAFVDAVRDRPPAVRRVRCTHKDVVGGSRVVGSAGTKIVIDTPEDVSPALKDRYLDRGIDAPGGSPGRVA
jgi:hypothetical protein